MSASLARVEAIGAALARMHPCSVMLAAAELPLLLLDTQRAAGNRIAVEAAAAPARMTFAMAAAALGFAGQELPGLFDGHAGSHNIGRQVRAAYDKHVAAIEASAEAPAP